MKSRIVIIEYAGHVFWQLFLRLELALFEVLASAELYNYKASTLQLVNFWNLRMIQKLEALNLHILSTEKKLNPLNAKLVQPPWETELTDWA